MSRLKLDSASVEFIRREIIAKNGMTAIAAKLGVPKNTFKRWISGKHTWPEEKFEVFSNYFPEVRKATITRKLSDDWGRSLGGKKYTQELKKTELHARMKKVRQARKINEQPVLLTDFRGAQALEFFGVMLGDGCISEYINNYNKQVRRETRITLNSLKDYDYAKNFLVPLITKLFPVKIRANIRKTSNTLDISCSDSRLFYWLKANNFPVGKKTNLRIPKKMMQLRETELSNILRGLLDTDGTISARKDEGYRYPHIIIASKSKILREQLKQTIVNLGINACIHKHSVIVRGKENSLKWFDKIGSNNPRNINRFKQWVETGTLKVGV